MAEAYIYTHRNQGFQVHELFGQFACHYILLELDNLGYAFSERTSLVDHYKQTLEGFHAGYASLLPDDYLTTPTDIRSMVELLQSISTKLRQKGQSITTDEIRAIPTNDTHFLHSMGRKPFETTDLIKLFTSMIAVLEGTWPENESWLLLTPGPLFRFG